MLAQTVAIASGAVAATAVGASSAKANPLSVPQSNKEMGHPIEAKAYGMPSKFEKHVTRNRTDVFVNKQNFSDWSMTPLQH